MKHASFQQAIDEVQSLHGGRMQEKGFWAGRSDSTESKLALIALMHSELSEAVEGIRKHKMDDHLPDVPMDHAEMADVVLRVFDYCAYYGIPLGSLILRKMEYNASRPHMHGGKSI